MGYATLVRIGIAAILVLSVGGTGAAQELLFPNSDFELGTLEGWTAEGNAFASQPTLGDNVKARTRAVSAGQQGRYWIGTFESHTGAAGTSPGDRQGDGPSGTLTSDPFVIRGERIAFLIGGGRNIDKTSVALVVSGTRRRASAAARNHETMQPATWEVADLIGKEARIVVTDAGGGAWGHVNVDYFHYDGDLAETATDSARGAPAPAAPPDPQPAPAGEETPTEPRRQLPEASDPEAGMGCMDGLVPPYPGASSVAVVDLGAPGHCKVVMEVDATLAEVFDFYASAMPDRGWEKLSDIRRGDGSIAAYRQGIRILHLSGWPTHSTFELTMGLENP